MAVTGIILTGAERTALIAVEGEPGVRRLGPGDRLRGWEVVAIEADRVTFRRDDSETVVRLSYEAPAGTPPKARRGKRRRR